MVSGVSWATLGAVHDSTGSRPAGRVASTMTVHFPQARFMIAKPSVSRVIVHDASITAGYGRENHVLVFIRKACGERRDGEPCIELTPEDDRSHLLEAHQISSVTFEIQVASMNRRVEGHGTGLVFLFG